VALAVALAVAQAASPVAVSVAVPAASLAVASFLAVVPAAVSAAVSAVAPADDAVLAPEAVQQVWSIGFSWDQSQATSTLAFPDPAHAAIPGSLLQRHTQTLVFPAEP